MLICELRRPKSKYDFSPVIYLHGSGCIICTNHLFSFSQFPHFRSRGTSSMSWCSRSTNVVNFVEFKSKTTVLYIFELGWQER